MVSLNIVPMSPYISHTIACLPNTIRWLIMRVPHLGEATVFRRQHSKLDPSKGSRICVSKVRHLVSCHAIIFISTTHDCYDRLSSPIHLRDRHWFYHVLYHGDRTRGTCRWCSTVVRIRWWKASIVRRRRSFTVFVGELLEVFWCSWDTTRGPVPM